MIHRERNWRKTCLSILLAVVCLMTSLLFIGIQAKAYTVIKTGTVRVSSSLNFRSGPGTTYGTIKSLYNGDSGTIQEEGKDSSGAIWYKMIVGGVTGWAHSKYIEVTTTVLGDDADFEAHLIAQGFPESYKEPLRLLHAKYPNWIFQAQQTNLTWDEVIAGEYSLGKCLVHSGAVTSWKSTQTGAYDWTTGKWVVFDTGGWVAASKDIIKYFMDPRNFLGESSVFQFLRQSYNASEYDTAGLAQVKEGLKSMVANTYLAGNCDNRPYVDVIMEVAAAKKVSPYVLASMMIQEIGVDGKSGSISGKEPGYEGYYNYFNVGAYASGGLTAVQKGLLYAKNSGWNTRYKSIAGGAENYAKGFIEKGQDTMYLKKFNVQGSNPYTNQYMTNVQGAYSEGLHMAKAYDAKARTGALTFRIPVYKNMPATASPQPTGDGNPNYMLKSLSVDGYSLTPTFDMYETSYSLIVDNKVSSISVKASTYVSSTSVTGTGTYNLSVGTNTIKVVTKAQNSSQRTYTISVVRKEAEVTPSQPSQGTTPKISISGHTINADGTVTGIKEFPIKVSDLKGKISVSNGTVKITTSNGTEKTDSSNIGTSDQIKLYYSNGTIYQIYNVVIYGDTNGDGKINTSDYVQIRKQILGTLSLGVFNKIGADVNKNGTVDLSDYVQLRKQILGTYQIQQ